MSAVEEKSVHVYGMRGDYLIIGARLACAALLSQAHEGAAAEPYPSKSVRIIVPYTPGGGWTSSAVSSRRSLRSHSASR